MTSKKYKSQNTRRFVPPSLPQSLSKNLDVEIRHIVQRFQSVARACVALLSDWFPATTGEIVHVDGGYHAVGA
jgi:enoyl-[acyl-carrier-protein] reductase (NADH)